MWEESLPRLVKGVDLTAYVINWDSDMCHRHCSRVSDFFFWNAAKQQQQLRKQWACADFTFCCLINNIIANIEIEVKVMALNIYVDRSCYPLHSSLSYKKKAKRQGESFELVKNFTNFGRWQAASFVRAALIH